MTDTTAVVVDDAMIDPVTGEIIDQKAPAERLLAQAKEKGVCLVGPGGLLNQLTKNVLETALNAELTEHLGHEHDETQLGVNMRSGPRTKTVLTEKVAGELPEWASRPLDALYPAVFVDAIVVKVRNTPFYVVMGVTVNGGNPTSSGSGPVTALKTPGSDCRCSPN